MDNPVRLEFLPNELLMYIFRYLQPEDLFRAFYDLNIRLNILLQTLEFLSLTPKFNHSSDDNYLPYIHGLILNRGIDINFTIFSQIRFLILRYPTEKSLNQLNHQTFPYLEHLRINHMHISLINRNADLCRKIFSNIFPRLASCYLFQWEKITNIQGWTYSSLRVLKIGIIDLLVYKTILSTCPNLYFLQFATVISNNTPMEIVQHKTLRRMIIKTTDFIPSWNIEDINICISYVPRLEYLTIYRSDTFIDWSSHLSFLRQFDYFFLDERKTFAIRRFSK